MDEYKVKITPQASAQMLEIFSYISGTLKEPTAAEKLLCELQKSILSLNTMPKRVPLVEEDPWRNFGVHRMPVKNFLVYFWINEELKEVHITVVIYGRRDQLAQLRQSHNALEKDRNKME